MKRRLIPLFASICLLCSNAFCQVVLDDGSAPTKKHPAELEKLAFTIGTWDTEAIAHFKPDSKEFKARVISVVRWSPNGQFLISDEWELMPGFELPTGPVPQGWLNKLVITTWNSSKNEYALVNVFSNGVYSMAMSSDGNGGVLSSDIDDGKQITHTRTTFERVSDSETKFRTECWIGQGPKWVASEGSSKRRSQ